MQDFQRLDVWQRAHKLTLAVYRTTSEFPDVERFGLARQVRRATSSIGANIAEGCGRDTHADFARFLQIAAGSASELANHLLLARDLGYIKRDALRPLWSELADVRRMLTALIKRVRTTNSPNITNTNN